MSTRIYVVEDDPALQELYSYSLEGEYDCTTFGDSASFFAQMAKALPQLIILDVMLPNQDGFAILTQLKSSPATENIPVIMVSAKEDEMSKVKGLNLGAADYMAKPFGVLELIARIKANLRKAPKAAKVVAFKDIVIDPQKHQITVAGTPIHTGSKEYNLLSLLCQHGDTVLEREDIFAKVWDEHFMGETRTLDIHIKELRRKLADANSQAEIKTIRSVGYMLC